MHFWWQRQAARTERAVESNGERSTGRRAAVLSRPRVASAVAAARQVHIAPDGYGLGSASLDYGALRHFEAVERAAQSGPLAKAQRRAKRGLEIRLLRETAREAERMGRRPEEIWAEALRDWLLVREEPAARPATYETRRQQVWGDIEATLGLLRAS
ncbi:MAG: hypothetical protein OJF49_002257 [Ktedonobacterales bacterium]|jgi:hypothetical protein|nr:MAG: hypothetical protein OJF49_002257 [Ktedonobacterales bacterium]